MNLLSGISSGFKAVFGIGQDGTNNVMTVAKGIGNFIDEQKFTEQENAIHVGTVIIPAMEEFMDSTVKENTQRSLTRREIAIWIMRNWFIMLWVSIFAYGLEIVIKATNHEFSAFVFKVASMQTMLYLVIGVGGFFFGAHLFRQFQGK